MNKLLEILRQHKDTVSYTLAFSNPEVLTIRFKDGLILELCEYSKCKTGKKNN